MGHTVRTMRWRVLILGAAAVMAFGACSSGGGASAAPSTAASAAASGGTTGAQPPADSPTVKQIKEAGKLVGGVGQVLPWTGLDTATNKYYGATVLIAEEIAKRIGVPLELKAVGNDIVVQEVGAGNIDLALYPLYVNPKRLEVIDMVPWHQGGFCYLVLKDNAKINKLEDLDQDGVRLQAFDGFPYFADIKAKYPKLTLVSRPQTSNGEFRDPGRPCGSRRRRPDRQPARLCLARAIPGVQVDSGAGDVPEQPGHAHRHRAGQPQGRHRVHGLPEGALRRDGPTDQGRAREVLRPEVRRPAPGLRRLPSTV